VHEFQRYEGEKHFQPRLGGSSGFRGPALAGDRVARPHKAAAKQVVGLAGIRQIHQLNKERY
jgi:hypothetical protein